MARPSASTAPRPGSSPESSVTTPNTSAAITRTTTSTRSTVAITRSWHGNLKDGNRAPQRPTHGRGLGRERDRQLGELPVVPAQEHAAGAAGVPFEQGVDAVPVDLLHADEGHR